MSKVGDIIEIPLTGERFAYAQYVYKDKMGPVIRVSNQIMHMKTKIGELNFTKLMFPPIITGVFAAIRKGYWLHIGFKKVENFVYPNFVSTLYDQKTGEAGIWYLWNGEKSIRLGPKLTDEYKQLEYLMVWDPHDVVHRIETGEYPFPYKDLILQNRFTPQ
jgi:hypothetical protein